MIDMVANEKGKDEFYMPIVYWGQHQEVRVRANSFEEAYKYVKAHKAELPIDDEELYILDNSYQIDGDYQECLKESTTYISSKQLFMCEKFACQKDLSVYVDSMLFDHFMSDKSLEDDESYVAGATFIDRNPSHVFHVRLVVAGEVRVIYKGTVYTTPSDFPDELTKLIKENPNMWQTGDGIGVDMQNWFEIVAVEANDAWVLEGDLSEMTPEDILQIMRSVAEDYFADVNDMVKVSDYGYMPTDAYEDMMDRLKEVYVEAYDDDFYDN